MPYLGKKPTDFADVTESQTFKVTESLDVQGNELVLDADGDTSITSDTDDVIDFRTAGSDRWQILANGNLKAATDGLGIDFSASEGSGASSSVLDDYEEGTWTPSFEMVTGSATFTYQDRAGYYTKVGRLVTVHFAVHSSGVTVTTDGKVRISGLPFTSSNANSLLRSYSVGFKQLIDTAEVGILFAINNSSNVIEMYEGHTSYPESARLVDASDLLFDRRVRGVLQYLV